jgi:hypothetical protein
MAMLRRIRDYGWCKRLVTKLYEIVNVVYVAQCAVRGAWCVVHGAWCVVCGVRGIMCNLCNSVVCGVLVAVWEWEIH